MKIDVKCKTENTLKYQELTDFQGELKKRDETDIRKILRSIIDYGFSFPFFVWRRGKKNYVLDGHGRMEALTLAASEGYEIPELPVVYIKAKDMAEAKTLLLQVNSLYGETSRVELLKLIDELGADLEDLSFPQVIFDDPNYTYDPDYYPDIDTSDIDDDDINAAEERMGDLTKNNEMVELTCKSCQGGIFIKREHIERYLRGEHV